MTDGVTLNFGSGGPVIDTETNSGRGNAQMQRVKIVLGAMDLDGGDVAAGNPMPVATPESLASTSTPLAGLAGSTAVVGPFSPQIGRDIWATLIGSSASGSAMLLRSIDGGATKLPITAGGLPWATWAFSSITGVIVNEAVVTSSDAATYYLSVTLSAGSVSYRLGQ